MQIDAVFLRSRALTQILGYSIEVYKKECLGVLLGDYFGAASITKVVVNSAFALQSAKRDYEEVAPRIMRYNRVKEILSFLSLDWILGEFHSHPDSGGITPNYHLSPRDQSFIRDEQEVEALEIVISIRKKKKHSPWTYIDEDRVLSGTMGDYFLQVAAYYKADDDDGGTMTDLWCPIVDISELAEEIELTSVPGYIFGYIPADYHRGRFRKLVGLIRDYEDIVIRNVDQNAGSSVLKQIKRRLRELKKHSD